MSEADASGICGYTASVRCGICDMDEAAGCADTYVDCAPSVGCSTTSGFAITITQSSDKLS